MRSVAFFNNKGGVGKTSLVYHLAWTFTELGQRVIAADLDPQANLTSNFLDEDRLADLWNTGPAPKTVYGCIEPLIEGTGDIAPPWLEEISDRLGILVGDLSLSRFEDQLSLTWPACLADDPRAFRVTSAFWRLVDQASREMSADIVLIDVGPNLGAINRAALIAADHVVVPLSPDLYSIQGLKNLGPTLRKWRKDWRDRLERKPSSLSIDLPRGDMIPIGYIVLQHSMRLDRPVKAYDFWLGQIPSVYRTAVLDQGKNRAPAIRADQNCLAMLKHYRSLMPMAQEARKPMFHLRAADGALGAHATAAQEVGKDFRELANMISERMMAAAR